MMTLVGWGRSGFNPADRARLEVFRAVFDRGPHSGALACIWQESGRSVSVEGDMRMVPAWLCPARDLAESAAGTLNRPGAMMAAGAAGQLWAGRLVPGGRTSGRAGKAG